MTTVLVTGASRGIGLGLVKHYAGSGCTVIAAVRNPSAAADLAALAGQQKTVRVEAVDVTDPSSVSRLASSLGRQPIDLLVANAGVIGPRGGLADPANTAGKWAEVLATNVTGVFFTIAGLATNVGAAKGKIAIISSRMGSSAAAAGSSYLYRASKAAAANLGSNFAAELRSHGVAVGVYHPGWVRTDMGGGGADISVETSVAGLASCFERLDVAESGLFWSYDGTRIAF